MTMKTILFSKSDTAHLHEHFEEPLRMSGQNYLPPTQPG